MKFINVGDKHAEYDFFEDVIDTVPTSKPRKIPSYIDTAKKHSSLQSKTIPKKTST